MTMWAPQKQDTLDALAAEILHNYGKGRVVVAVDGVDGSGKTHFADALGEALRRAGHTVVRASIDGFHNPRAKRHERGASSPEGFYRDSYDYETFRRVLIDPFKDGGTGSFVLEAFDHRRDAPVEPKWITGKPDTILLLDGIFLNRPELRGLWNYSIWLDVEPTIAAQRCLARDGESGIGDRYTKGQALYVQEARPSAAANAIVDNNDFEHPRRVFADSC
jgi:uridine kinase